MSALIKALDARDGLLLLLYYECRTPNIFISVK